jgi:hypothetical protein
MGYGPTPAGDVRHGVSVQETRSFTGGRGVGPCAAAGGFFEDSLHAGNDVQGRNGIGGGLSEGYRIVHGSGEALDLKNGIGQIDGIVSIDVTGRTQGYARCRNGQDQNKNGNDFHRFHRNTPDRISYSSPPGGVPFPDGSTYKDKP